MYRRKITFLYFNKNRRINIIPMDPIESQSQLFLSSIKLRLNLHINTQDYKIFFLRNFGVPTRYNPIHLIEP